MAPAWLLTVANKRLYVYEDPRIDQVDELLPKYNRGSVGCRNFAEEPVAGHLEPAKCTVNVKDMNGYIASLLCVAMGEVEKRVARLACAGERLCTYRLPLSAYHLVQGCAARLGIGNSEKP